MIATDDQSRRASIAGAFVDARRAARPLAAYPGPRPLTLDEGYAIQAAAIGRWGEPVTGWKIARVPDPLVPAIGANRLAGPIFASGTIAAVAGEIAGMPVIDGGFAAIEAEFVAVLGDDPPPGKTRYSPAEAAALIARLHCGIEIAGSPLASIIAAGPAAGLADFAINAGLIVGPEIADWRRSGFVEWPVEVVIDGRPAGRNIAETMLDGPIGAVRFLLETAAARGLAIGRGTLVATGAVSGVHPAAIGAEATALFGDAIAIRCRLVAAAPTTG